MTVRVEPMVSVGDITRYLIPKGYTLAVTLEIADASLGGLGKLFHTSNQDCLDTYVMLQY